MTIPVRYILNGQLEWPARRRAHADACDPLSGMARAQWRLHRRQAARAPAPSLCVRGVRLRGVSYAAVSEPLWPFTLIELQVPAGTNLKSEGLKLVFDMPAQL